MSEPIPAEGNIAVFIARGVEQVPPETPRPYAAVSPDNDNWNDYGYGHFAALGIVDSDGVAKELHFRIMFEGVTRSVTALDAILNVSQGQAIDIDDVSVPFVSLLADVADYRALIESLGFGTAITLLRKLHDAVVARAEGVDETALRLTGLEAFHVGVLRHEGAYDAFMRGGRFLRPDHPPEVGEVTGTYRLTSSLPNADNPHEVELEFTPDLIFRDRACVVIGRNGVGKTQLLRAAVDALMRDETRPSKFEPALEVSRILVFSSVPTDPFPRLIPAWKGIDYDYFAVNASMSDRPAPLIGALMTCWRDRPSALHDEGTWSRHSVLLGMLKTLGLGRSLYFPLRPTDGVDDLRAIIGSDGKPYFPYASRVNEQSQLRLSHRLDWDSWPVALNAELEPRELSSGEHALLRISALMAAAIEPGSLLLLDEPETHLHPNFVSELMSMLHELLDTTKSAAIIATHSAYVVREVGREKVNVIALDGREVQCDRPRMQTFGASIDSISQFVFGDSNLHHRFRQSLERWLETGARGLGIEAIVEQFGNQLNSEALSLMARRIREKSGQG